MSQRFTATIVEDDVQLSLAELCRACRTHEEQIHVWVVEGVLEPSGPTPEQWRFAGASLRRARLALALARDLEVNPPGVALALDLLDEVDALRSKLRRTGAA